MNCMEKSETQGREGAVECVVQMPLGLLGLERLKRLTLSSNPEEEPFLRLHGLEEPKPTFLVISPFIVQPAYQPEIAEEDRRFLALEDPNDSLLFNIVTVRGPRQATVNLKGPILLNRRTLRAKQVIPLNAMDYSVAHPLPVLAS